MNQRSGATLIEVLVAIFVMALGLMGLLVLFPVGALSMFQAIQDSRAAQAAANGAAASEIIGVRHDVNLAYVEPQPTPHLESFFATLPRRPLPDDPPPPFPPGPWPNLSDWQTPGTLEKWDGPSYPVFVDFLGAQIPSTGEDRVGEYRGLVPSQYKSPGFPRVRGSFTANHAQYLRWCTSLDDIQFRETGLAATPISREPRYSWAYLLRRPRFRAPSVVDLSVVVYRGRSSALRGEQAYGLVPAIQKGIRFDKDQSTLLVYWTPGIQEKPQVRAGSWILDATVVRPNPNPPFNPPFFPEPHGFFYRVTNVTEVSTSPIGQLELQLETKPRASTFQNSADPNRRDYGVLVVLENVVEVFEKSAGWLP